MDVRDIPAVQRLGTEILEILYSAYLLRHQAFNSGNTLSNMRETKVTSLLVNDVIVRLGKFRDDDNRDWSFRQAAKALKKKSSMASRAALAEPLIEKFIEKSKRLEDYRNLVVAHLPKRGTGHLKPLTDLFDLVLLAVQVVDALSGEINVYRIEHIDLRREVCNNAPG